MKKKQNRRTSGLVIALILGSAMAAIGIYSQNLQDTITAAAMLVLVWGHFRTRRGTKFGTPESSAAVSMILGLLLIISSFYAWSYALDKGGFWWVIFAVFVIACLRAGNAVKESLEQAVRDSRKEQKSPKQPRNRVELLCMENDHIIPQPGLTA